MKVRKFSCFALTVAVGLGALITFAGAQAAPQKARLAARFHFNPARGAVRAAAPLSQLPDSPGPPLWSFTVNSARDGNQYTGVTVGSNPFDDDSRSTRVATQIIPIIFKTHRRNQRQREEHYRHRTRRHDL